MLPGLVWPRGGTISETQQTRKLAVGLQRLLVQPSLVQRLLSLPWNDSEPGRDQPLSNTDASNLNFNTYIAYTIIYIILMAFLV
jgi:hypothetical protein